MAKQKPIGIVVRRGAWRRFEGLTRKSADLPVVVSWDRRTADRRGSDEPAPLERRSNDRRKDPGFTWDAADFVVCGSVPEEAAPETPRSGRAKKDEEL